MDRTALVKAVVARTALVKAVVARTVFATALVVAAVGTHNVLDPDRIVHTVPNHYDCSRVSQQCWQTNPPHAAAVVNRCTWLDVTPAAPHPAATAICDRRTVG